VDFNNSGRGDPGEKYRGSDVPFLHTLPGGRWEHAAARQIDGHKAMGSDYKGGNSTGVSI